MGRLATLKRYYHTLRYLKREQFLYRLRYRVQKNKQKSRAIDCVRREAANDYAFQPMPFSGKISDTEAHFLGQSINLKEPALWNHPDYPKLFLYNLHYFDVLNAKVSDKETQVLEQLIERWIADNPVFEGNGWEPYPLSLRIVNWIKYFCKNTSYVQSRWHASLSVQVQALLKQLEFHILGNHLFANAKALVFAGAYFEGETANYWLKKGLKLLDREIPEQFLADGGHFERSPMYHATLLWDMCDLYALCLQSGIGKLRAKKEEWRVVIEKGIDWLSGMTHPDGEIAFFNDATFGIAPNLCAVKYYAELLGISTDDEHESITHYDKTGYCVVNINESSKLILDVGEVGPLYQPGHAHADTLSFELSLKGQRVLVNSGISQYGQDAMRHMQRSTKAHNTVCVDDKNSSDVWSGFRVGRRAQPSELHIKSNDGTTILSCGHDGYQKNIHTRTWHINKNNMQVIDYISGHFLSSEAYFYLHPDIQAASLSPTCVELNLLSGEQVLLSLESLGELYVKEAFWYPGFGKIIANYCIVGKFENNELISRIKW